MAVSEEVLKAIASEKAYQQVRWPEPDPGHPGQPANDRTIDEYALYTSVYAQKLAEISATSGNPKEILDVFRKVATLCVNAMEQHGAPQREGFEVG